MVSVVHNVCTTHTKTKQLRSNIIKNEILVGLYILYKNFSSLQRTVETKNEKTKNALGYF